MCRVFGSQENKGHEKKLTLEIAFPYYLNKLIGDASCSGPPVH